MSFTSLSFRLNPQTGPSTIPLVLCGPILRKTTPTEISVWIALKSSKNLTLKVYNGSTLVAQGTRQTVELGASLHVAVVKAIPTGSPLVPSINYTYDIEFTSSSTKLSTVGVLAASSNGIASITYPGFTLPSFSLPPADFNKLRIIHASCRKPHGEGPDALEGLHQMINMVMTDSANSAAAKAEKRPHQIFMTGDQIYADDVADTLLYMLRDASNALLLWLESLPASGNMFPGQRAEFIKTSAKFSSTDNKSHLITLGEYYCMYLFAWSPVLWDAFPTAQLVYPSTSSYSQSVFTTENERLTLFVNALPSVRKALANIPSYMILDDHEITDDLYITKSWFDGVNTSPLGNRVISNGLAAYAVFQDWGNRPSYYSSGQRGNDLLAVLGPGTPNFTTIDKLVRPKYNVGIKGLIPQEVTSSPLKNGIDWHYSLTMPNYEVIVLDCRCRRGFPGGDKGHPAVIASQNLATQISAPLSVVPQLTFIISPGPVFGVPFFEEAQSFWGQSHGDILDSDQEGWGFAKRQEDALQDLLLRLGVRAGGSPAQCRIAFLCGDVHFGYTVRSQFWSTPLGNPSGNYNSVIVQLTASSLKNQVTSYKGSSSLHEYGFARDSQGVPPPIKMYGYQTPTPPRTIATLSQAATSQSPVTSPLVVQKKVSPFIHRKLVTLTNVYGTKTVLVIDQPDYRYRVDFIMDRSGIQFRPIRNSVPVASALSGTLQNVLSLYAQHASNYSEYAQYYGNGKEIVGVNNIGEITFDWPQNTLDPKLVHTLWWRLLSYTNTPGLMLPLTRCSVSLSYVNTTYPMPSNV